MNILILFSFERKRHELIQVADNDIIMDKDEEYGHNCRTCKQYNGEGSDYQDEENITEVDDNDIDDLS